MAKAALDKQIITQTTTTKYTSRGNEETLSSNNSEETEDDFNDSDLTEFYQNNPISIDGVLNRVWRLIFPQFIALLLQRMTMIINVFFISLSGYYGIESYETTQATIKGIGLGSIIINVFFYGISIGLNGGLETLVALCYGSSNNTKESELYRLEMKRQCGNFLNISRVINSVVMIALSIVLIMFCEEILVTFFKQNAFVSEIAMQYCVISLPGLWAMS